MVDFAMPGMNGLEVIAEEAHAPATACDSRDGLRGRGCIEGPRRWVRGAQEAISDRRSCAHREGCLDALACLKKCGFQRRCDLTSQLISTHNTCKPRGVCAAIDAVTHR